MSQSATDEILDAANHLPSGATLTVPEVSWDEYERLLSCFGNRRDLRVSYDCGHLEIVSPSNLHDSYVRVFDRLLSRYAQVRNVDVEMYGHTTWTRRALAKGIEADCCYFVKNAKFVIGKPNFDVETVPPPDIAVEIDITKSSLKKLAIYAALQVPEVWRYDGRTLRIYELREGKYVEREESSFFSDLTGAFLCEFLDLAQTQGQTKAVQKFSRRISRSRG